MSISDDEIIKYMKLLQSKAPDCHKEKFSLLIEDMQRVPHPISILEITLKKEINDNVYFVGFYSPGPGKVANVLNKSTNNYPKILAKALKHFYDLGVPKKYDTQLIKLLINIEKDLGINSHASLKKRSSRNGR